MYRVWGCDMVAEGKGSIVWTLLVSPGALLVFMGGCWSYLSYQGLWLVPVS